MSNFGIFRELGGKVKLLIQYFLVKIHLKKLIYFSDSETSRQGLYLPYDLLLSIQRKVDVVIAYPDFIPKRSKRAFNGLAQQLAKDNIVLVHEVIVEAGGGGEEISEAIEAIATTLKFAYDSFQPIIDLVGRLLVAYEIVRKIYKEKRNPIINSQFTIRRISDGVRYNYVFDRLKTDIAIRAAKLIPGDKPGNFLENEGAIFKDIYLRFEPKKSVWIEFEDYQL